MANLDICNPGWIEVVFANRNKDYGAYQLRINNSKTELKALFIGSLFFILVLGGSTIYRTLAGIVPAGRSLEEARTITLTEIPREKPPIPPPAEELKVEAPKFVNPVVVPADEVKNDDPPTIDDLKLTLNTGAIEGSPDAGSLKIEIAEAPRITKVIEEVPVTPEAVQISPEFPGGKEGWIKFMGGYNYPAMAREINASGIVYVSFVVEKDGSLTDIKVLRDIGYGTGEEALRLLKTSPKWSPGVQNGLRVRVAYTQPIKLAIQ